MGLCNEEMLQFFSKSYEEECQKFLSLIPEKVSKGLINARPDMFTGFCRRCKGCTNMDIEDHKRAIVCFEAQLADRGGTHSRHAKNIAAHKKALIEGKVMRYYPRPEGDGAKPGGNLENQALTKNKFDKHLKTSQLRRSELTMNLRRLTLID